MTIANKLTYLAGTKAALRDAINAAGGNIGTADTFRSYAGGWLRDQSATLSLDFAQQQYVAKDTATKFPDRAGFSNIVTFTRASTGNYFDANGVLQVAAANQPRFDHDPVTGAPLGLLIEEQRTNLLTYSSDFSNAVWVKRGTFSVTPNAAISPDGTANATLVTGLNSGNNDMYRLGINSGGLAAEARFEPSVYVKKVTQTGTVNISNAYTPSYGNWTVDLSKVGDGWERITRSHPAVIVVVEFKVHTTGYLSIQLRKTTIGEVSLYIWGAQLEAGAFPTSYIPTEASQVTRAADVASVNTLSPWYNASEGTFEVSARGIVGQSLLTAGSAVITADSAAFKDYSLSYTADPSASSLVIGKGYIRGVKYFPRAAA